MLPKKGDKGIVILPQEESKHALAANHGKPHQFKKGDVVLDIGGGKFDNAVKNLAKSNVEVKVYDPFNRSPVHNKSVVNSIKDGGADKVVSFNTLNVIPEEANRLKVIEQAHNATLIDNNFVINFWI